MESNVPDQMTSKIRECEESRCLLGISVSGQEAVR